MRLLVSSNSNDTRVHCILTGLACILSHRYVLLHVDLTQNTQVFLAHNLDAVCPMSVLRRR